MQPEETKSEPTDISAEPNSARIASQNNSVVNKSGGVIPNAQVEPQNNIPLKTKVFLIVLGVIILAIALLFVQSRINSSNNKKAIDKEMSDTVTPANCAVKSKNYNQGDGVDSVATWNLSYNCSVNPGTVYSEVKDAAASKGYVIKRDKDNIIRGSFYSAQLCLARDGYFSSWDFETNTNVINQGPSVSLDIHSTKYFPCT